MQVLPVRLRFGCTKHKESTMTTFGLTDEQLVDLIVDSNVASFGLEGYTPPPGMVETLKEFLLAESD